MHNQFLSAAIILPVLCAAASCLACPPSSRSLFSPPSYSSLVSLSADRLGSPLPPPHFVRLLYLFRREILHVACGNNCTLVLAGAVAFPTLFEMTAGLIRGNPKLCADVGGFAALCLLMLLLLLSCHPSIRPCGWCLASCQRKYTAVVFRSVVVGDDVVLFGRFLFLFLFLFEPLSLLIVCVCGIFLCYPGYFLLIILWGELQVPPPPLSHGRTIPKGPPSPPPPAPLNVNVNVNVDVSVCLLPIVTPSRCFCLLRPVLPIYLSIYLSGAGRVVGPAAAERGGQPQQFTPCLGLR